MKFDNKKNKQIMVWLGITFFFLVIPSGTFALDEIGSTSLLYEEVKQNEDVRRIAEKIRPSHITVEQMMLALQRENPDAFYGDNVSLLKAGVALRIADISMLDRISVDSAAVEIARQHREWLAYRQEHRPEYSLQAEISDIEKQEWRDRLSTLEKRMAEIQGLIQVQKKMAFQISAHEQKSQFEISTAKAIDKLETEKRENKALLQRLMVLEAELAEIESLIRLKDVALQEQAFANIKANTSVSVNPQGIVVTSPQEKNTRYFFSDGFYFIAAMSIVLILVFLVWVVRKRRTEAQHFAAEGDEQKKPAVVVPEVESAETKSEEEVINFNALAASRSATGLSEKMGADNNQEPVDFSEVMLEPLAEADVYLTYEKYEKAETLLKRAIEDDPCRQELKLKLLEVFALARNIEKFDKQAEVLFIAINRQEENFLWQHALLMAQDLDTQSSLFFSEKRSSLKNDRLSEEDKREVSFSMETRSEKTKNLFADDTEVWSETAGEEVNEIVTEAIENAATNSIESITVSENISATSTFFVNNGIDEKLDLAKAYIEMGDHPGALDLLDQVLKDGTFKQKEEAKEIMALD